MIQTLDRNLENEKFSSLLSDVDVVFIDEIHLFLNERTRRVVRKINPKVAFGLTGTLDLEKPYIAYPAHALTGPVLFRYDIRQGIREGHVNKGLVVRAEFNSVAVKTKNGSSSEEDYRTFVVRNPGRNDFVVALAKQAATASRRTVVFVTAREHLEVLSREFRKAGVRFTALSGSSSKEERIRACDQFENGEVPVMLVTSIFTTGIDLMTLDTTIDVAAGRGCHVTKQKYGRGTRTHLWKARSLHIDVADVGCRFSENARERKKFLKQLGVPVLRVYPKKLGMANPVAFAERVFRAVDLV